MTSFLKGEPNPQGRGLQPTLPTYALTLRLAVPSPYLAILVLNYNGWEDTIACVETSAKPFSAKSSMAISIICIFLSVITCILFSGQN